MPNRTHRRSERGALAKVLSIVPQGRPTVRPGRPPEPNEVPTTERAIAAMAACITDSALTVQAQQSQLGIVQELFRARACYLVRNAPGRAVLQVTAVRGRNDKRIAAAKPGRGVVGRAFSEKRVIRDGPVVAAPLVTARGVIGCLVVVSATRAFSDELLEALAAQISALTEVARLRDEAMRRNKDLQTAVSGLKSLEKNRESLLANVSHDLKNPLTTIKAYLNMLERRKLGEITDRQLNALQVCERNANRLLRMINDLLLVSRLKHGRMQLNERPFGLKELAQEVVQSLSNTADQAGVGLLIPPCTEAYVRGDRDRIAEAIGNVVENAIHHSPAGKPVEIKVSSSASGLAVVTVADHGAGIAEANRERIFDPFYRARTLTGRSRSRGLGLPIAARIVQQHGGRIELISKPGEGACFQIHLPVFAAAAVAPVEPVHTPGEGRILLVEDDADCREVLQELLEEAGYPVLATASMASAVAALAKMRPAMVLLDLMLSDGDGRSVLHFIRELPALSDVRVFVISGASDAGSLAGGKGKDRIDGLFEKPLRLQELLSTVASVVHPPSAARS
ncbi:MAG TPA: ATP-binding protein [Myxococcaceae bacterium]|nr:ATP-binding protein [Myxococcaceae bacterium]